MSDYANWDDVVGRYPKTDNVADSVEMATSYIEGVESIMNSYLAKVFTVPLTGEPPLLKDICIDLVYSKIAFHKDKAAGGLRVQAIEMLKQIVEGEMLVVDSSGVIIETVGHGIWSSTQDYFDAFSMLGSPDDRIDPDLLDDLADERG